MPKSPKTEQGSEGISVPWFNFWVQIFEAEERMLRQAEGEKIDKEESQQ